ncbi:MAG: hypothetical protein ACYTBJ_22185, partial [Planctomycetota bacterium]
MLVAKGVKRIWNWGIFEIWVAHFVSKSGAAGGADGRNERRARSTPLRINLWRGAGNGQVNIKNENAKIQRINRKGKGRSWTFFKGCGVFWGRFVESFWFLVEASPECFDVAEFETPQPNGGR